MDDLGALLHLGAGVKAIAETAEGTVPLRMAPSAGSLQPVNVYVAACDVTGVPPGIYSYHPVRHALDLVRRGDPRDALANGCLQEFVATAPATVVLTCSLDRVRWRYGSRAYRSVHLDAGVQCHNLLLVAADLGLGCCAVFGFFEERLDEILAIDGTTEFTTLVMPIGYPATTGPPR